MAKPFSPLLAYSETPSWDYFAERMPWLLSFKLDGIRAIKLPDKEKLVSRTVKPFPAAFPHQFACPCYDGLDGELVVCRQQGPTIYHDTYSAVMTQGSMEEVNWWIFDLVNTDIPYSERQRLIRTTLLEYPHPNICLLEQRRVETIDDMMAYEQEALDSGYEGLIARDPEGMYRYNRSSLKQRNLIKIVRKVRFEVIVEDMVEMMKNNNEPILDVRGYTVRSSHKANLVPTGMMGTLICRRLDTNIVFGVGTGFDHALRKHIFDTWPAFKGVIGTVECKPYGEKDLPRQPSWIGLSDKHTQPSQGSGQII